MTENGKNGVAVASNNAAAGEESDEKYDKARKQGQRALVIFLSVIFVLVASGSALFLFNDLFQNRLPSEDKQKQLPLATNSKKKNSNGIFQSSVKSKTFEVSRQAYAQFEQEELEHPQEVPPPIVIKSSPTTTEASMLQLLNEDELQDLVNEWDSKVRAIKARVDIFETNHEAQEAARQLQNVTRLLLHKRYGPAEPYRVVVHLEFQPTIPDYSQRGKHGTFTIELAPSTLQPHSIYTFLELVRNWRGGAFHRIAPHVLQVLVRSHTIPHLAFQEYSPLYPHREKTVGYAGRPSGPAWYVSIEDNSKIHGPGSQQRRNPHEADSCFGRVIDGYDTTVQRIKRVPGTGFLMDAKKHVVIKYMKIFVPDGKDGYKKWVQS